MVLKRFERLLGAGGKGRLWVESRRRSRLIGIDPELPFKKGS